LSIYDGEHFRAAAMHGVPEPFAELLLQPFRPGLDVANRLLAGENLVHIADMAALTYDPDDRIGRGAVELAGVRTILIVPLRKDNRLLGYITAHRQEVRPFSDKQIALLQNFAAQAVIAMESARLITETREALEQQTATAEVLGVINSSPGDLTPVFDAILEKAHTLCGIAFGSLQLYDRGKFRAVAVRGVADALAELLRQPLEPQPGTPQARLLAGERFVQIADVIEAAKQLPDETRAQAAVAHGLRTTLFVPLRRELDLLGYIAAFRKEVQPFTDKQIALLQNFAAQAIMPRRVLSLRKGTISTVRTPPCSKAARAIGSAASNAVSSAKSATCTKGCSPRTSTFAGLSGCRRYGCFVIVRVNRSVIPRAATERKNSPSKADQRRCRRP
jgi:GAF domain-containing protein